MENSCDTLRPSPHCVQKNSSWQQKGGYFLWWYFLFHHSPWCFFLYCVIQVTKGRTNLNPGRGIKKQACLNWEGHVTIIARYDLWTKFNKILFLCILWNSLYIIFNFFNQVFYIFKKKTCFFKMNDSLIFSTTNFSV